MFDFFYLYDLWIHIKQFLILSFRNELLKVKECKNILLYDSLLLHIKNVTPSYLLLTDVTTNLVVVSTFHLCGTFFTNDMQTRQKYYFIFIVFFVCRFLFYVTSITPIIPIILITGFVS